MPLHPNPEFHPNPESVIPTATGRLVELKVHGCVWSGQYPENSLPAIEECYQAQVARAEIDLCPLRDADFLVVHDLRLDAATDGHGSVMETSRHEAQQLRLRRQGVISNERPPLFSEVVALIRRQPYPTRLELDLKGGRPLPWPRVEELARLAEPVKDRITFNSTADWNLRRLLHVDPTLPVGFDPAAYLDWEPPDETPPLATVQPAEFGDEWEREGLSHGAYGYLDAHPLARERLTSVDEYLADRLGGILRLVPGAGEVHLRLATFERMLDDGVTHAAGLFHRHGLSLDVWTLDAGTPHWQARLARALAAGVDIITTNTARILSAAAGPHAPL